jgi:hypothetical protein
MRRTRSPGLVPGILYGPTTRRFACDLYPAYLQQLALEPPRQPYSAADNFQAGECAVVSRLERRAALPCAAIFQGAQDITPV